MTDITPTQPARRPRRMAREPQPSNVIFDGTAGQDGAGTAKGEVTPTATLTAIETRVTKAVQVLAPTRRGREPWGSGRPQRLAAAHHARRTHRSAQEGPPRHQREDRGRHADLSHRGGRRCRRGTRMNLEGRMARDVSHARAIGFRSGAACSRDRLPLAGEGRRRADPRGVASASPPRSGRWQGARRQSRADNQTRNLALAHLAWREARGRCARHRVRVSAGASCAVSGSDGATPAAGNRREGLHGRRQHGARRGWRVAASRWRERLCRSL